MSALTEKQALALTARPATAVSLYVPGAMVPWKRARRNGSRYFTDDAQSAFYDRIQQEWLKAGSPQLPEGLLEVDVAFLFPRPKSHLLVDGTLSAAGRKSLKPAPDDDNMKKAPLDALNTLAWHDDRQFTTGQSVTAWCVTPHTAPYHDPTQVYLPPGMYLHAQVAHPWVVPSVVASIAKAVRPELFQELIV